MYPTPKCDLKPNTGDFERYPLVSPNGFREYDVRWLFPDEINLLGIHMVGVSLAGKIRAEAGEARVVVAHDYRSYSAGIKMALTSGLMAGGAEVFDIGLAVSPMAYFAQVQLGVPGVAMVTASHNENGWTGVKMGASPPLTFGPDTIAEMKDEVLSGKLKTQGGGRYAYVAGMAEKYIDDLASHGVFKRKMKAVVACGNGTAGAFAPQVLERLGIEVVPLHTELDHTFPNHNPNPEDLAMLHAVAEAVERSGADIGLAFDGDGDRCGVVDNTGAEIFADKVGVLLARDISARHGGGKFVVDVKSTGLFHTDPVLKANGASTEYWKTGHSHIKRRSFETGALAGFEKSGHFFLNPPLGRGYDDGLVSAIAVLDMLDHNPDMTMAGLAASLPRTWGSPTMSPHCADEIKYDVVARAVAHFGAIAEARGVLAGQNVTDAITVNGIRIVLQDGTWGLVRASSNKPELVVVVESPTSEANMRAIFAEIDGYLSAQPEVGEYNQKI
ncbi:Phosphoglucosamine mutase / Phosphomannomutase [hydrothermal vent metagenome]|uniref:Phosphoglucosamine mutase / Phosphomannomutase n=1 Tax=hydrothermal vent metagenome TaxID=652676 RepID=A0A3B0TAP8_9ZZZZ